MPGRKHPGPRARPRARSQGEKEKGTTEGATEGAAAATTARTPVAPSGVGPEGEAAARAAAGPGFLKPSCAPFLVKQRPPPAQATAPPPAAGTARPRAAAPPKREEEQGREPGGAPGHDTPRPPGGAPGWGTADSGAGRSPLTHGALGPWRSGCTTQVPRSQARPPANRQQRRACATHACAGSTGRPGTHTLSATRPAGGPRSPPLGGVGRMTRTLPWRTGAPRSRTGHHPLRVPAAWGLGCHGCSPSCTAWNGLLASMTLME